MGKQVKVEINENLYSNIINNPSVLEDNTFRCGLFGYYLVLVNQASNFGVIKENNKYYATCRAFDFCNL